MTLPTDAVIWAYRLFLGREPENQQMIDQFTGLDSIADLRANFVNSAEFTARYGGSAVPVASASPIGRFMDETVIDVETRCSERDLQAMLDGIAANWRQFGETEPHWSVLVADEFRPENIARNIDMFYASGGTDIDTVLASLKRCGIRTDRFQTALDFGCGVGRLTLALAPYAASITGVDISGGHLAVATERAALTGTTQAKFERISAVTDLRRYRDLDLIISLIVLQHNPPPIMAEIFRNLLAALRPGGVAVIQVPTFIANTRFSVAEYLASTPVDMEMNALPQPVVFEIVQEAGCRVLEVREDDCVGQVGLSHRFTIQRVQPH